jgi:hypothetical protein
MIRSKKAEPEPEVPLFWGMTPNQIVAYNLTQARQWKGWTQDQAAETLEPYVGSRWSKANFSAAERSVTGERVRNFDADEIVAFAQAFELPVTFFFMPPMPWAENLPVRLQTPAAGPLGEALAKMIDLVFGETHNLGLLSVRLENFLDALGPEPVTAAQHRIKTLADVRLGKLIQKAFRDLERWQTQLRSMANQLEGMVAQAKHVMWEETELPEGFRQ